MQKTNIGLGLKNRTCRKSKARSKTVPDLLREHRRKGFHEHGYGSERTAGFRSKPHEACQKPSQPPEPPTESTPYEGGYDRAKGFPGD